MQVIENLKIKEKVYIEKLENGLTVMIIPKKNIRKKYIIWGTNYGSNDSKFIVPGEKEETVVPDGVAHFLEHKMFEQENGTNSLDVLSALGVNANAYTTNDHTAYLFECTDKFYEALDELMDYVQKPYFTYENVEKEKGIIGQEIMMYDDSPEWRVYINAMKAMYHNNPVKLDIAGSVESISYIDKDILYKCYNTFYNPSNMAMAVCGDFEPEQILNEIKSRLIEKEPIGDIKRIYSEEPSNIVKKQEVQKMEVSQPIFVIGIKDNPLCSNDAVKKHIAVEILLNMLLGHSSELYKKLYEEGLLIQATGNDYEFSKYYAHVMISGQSKNPHKIYEELKNKIAEFKQKGLNEEDFERAKKLLYGIYTKEYNDVGDIARMFLADYFKGINSFEYIEEITTVTKSYTEQILNDVFKEEKMIISVVEGK